MGTSMGMIIMALSVLKQANSRKKILVCSQANSVVDDLLLKFKNEMNREEFVEKVRKKKKRKRKYEIIFLLYNNNYMINSLGFPSSFVDWVFQVIHSSNPINYCVMRNIKDWMICM